MTDLPITPDEEAELVRQMTDLLHIHLPDARSRAAVLIGAGITMLASEYRDEGLRFAAYVSLTTAEEASRAIGVPETTAPALALGMAADKFVEHFGAQHGAGIAREVLEAVLTDLSEQEREGRH